MKSNVYSRDLDCLDDATFGNNFASPLDQQRKVVGQRTASMNDFDKVFAMRKQSDPYSSFSLISNKYPAENTPSLHHQTQPE